MMRTKNHRDEQGPSELQPNGWNSKLWRFGSNDFCLSFRVMASGSSFLALEGIHHLKGKLQAIRGRTLERSKIPLGY